MRTKRLSRSAGYLLPCILLLAASACVDLQINTQNAICNDDSGDCGVASRQGSAQNTGVTNGPELPDTTPVCPDDADCFGVECGPDPICGVDCGSCPDGRACRVGFCVHAQPVCPEDALCTGRACGPDPVCGVTCGSECPDSQTCSEDGQCVDLPPGCPETQDCTNRACGLDPVCGLSCGDCETGEMCNSEGACIPTCEPQCNGRECGDDGCGGSCGDCNDPPDPECQESTLVTYPEQGTCDAGQCRYEPETQDCDLGCSEGTCVTCVDDGTTCDQIVCGVQTNNCGDPVECECASGMTCHGGSCCAPNCDGLACGEDGCGGSCGDCDSPPTPYCDGNDLVLSNAPSTCESGTCYYTETRETCANGCADGACNGCVASCVGLNCGDDGCGGSCGTCSGYDTCGGGGEPGVCGCTPLTCAFGTCGTLDDGCGGAAECSTCSEPETCGGGGVPNVCGCTDATACDEIECGEVSNACDQVVNCGTCGDGAQCVDNHCQCAPGSCGPNETCDAGTGECVWADTCGNGSADLYPEGPEPADCPSYSTFTTVTDLTGLNAWLAGPRTTSLKINGPIDLGGNPLAILTKCDVQSTQSAALIALGNTLIVAHEIDLYNDFSVNGRIDLRAAQSIVLRTAVAVTGSLTALTMEAPTVDDYSDESFSQLYCMEGTTVTIHEASRDAAGGGDVMVRGQTVDVYGDFTNVGAVTYQSTGDLIYRDAADLIQAGPVKMAATGFLDVKGSIQASGDIVLSGQTFTHRDSSTLEGAGDVRITISGTPQADFYGDIKTSGDVRIDAPSIYLRDSAHITLDGDVSLNIFGRFDGRGDITLNQNVVINTGSFYLYGSHHFTGNASCTISGSQLAGSVSPNGCVYVP